jgi:GNAT superfamily N-acetyltransferase
MDIRPFCPEDEPAVIALWEACGLTRPWNNPRRDIQRKLRVQAHLFLVGAAEGRLVGTVMAGYEGHRGWINYLAVSPAHQGKGFGRLLMEQAERLLREAGCPKINLQVRSANTPVIEFYRRLGYGVDDVVSMGKRLEQDPPLAAAGEEGPALPPPFEAGLRAHRLTVGGFLDHARALDLPQWNTPRAPGKWTPAQEAAHLALVYAAFTAPLRGGPPRALCVPAARAEELRRTVLPGILAGQAFPTGARAPEGTTPPEEPGDPRVLLPRLRAAAEEFEQAFRAAGATSPAARVVHPYFGPLPLLDLLGLLTAHTRHHQAFLPAGPNATAGDS